MVPDQDITFFTIPLPSWLRSRLDNDGPLGVDFGTREVVTEPVKSPLHLVLLTSHSLYASLRASLGHPVPITLGRTVRLSKAP